MADTPPLRLTFARGKTVTFALVFSGILAYIWAAGGHGVLSYRFKKVHMGPLFGRAKVENERPLAAVTALEQRVDALERENRGLRLEWENVYDKVIKAVSRINARHRRETNAEPPAAELSEEEPPSADHTFGSHAALAAARDRR